MWGVWGFSLDRVHAESSDDLTWKSNRADTTVDPPDGRVDRTYRISFPMKGGGRRCQVEGCPGALATRTAMRVHLVHRHVQDTVVMLEEVNLPYPCCPRCDL